MKKSTGFKMSDEGTIIEDCTIKVRHEHGTAIALIIKQLCKKVKFISINILDENLLTDGRILIRAFKSAIGYVPDIIHLSLGTTRCRYKLELKKLVKDANSKNIIVVSAANNEGRRSYPAYLKYVIGVKSGDYKSYMEYEYKKGFFYSPYNISQIDGMNELQNKNMCGSSIAAAYITGHIATIKYKNYSQENYEIIKELKLNANTF